jgi:hypothetical protein
MKGKILAAAGLLALAALALLVARLVPERPVPPPGSTLSVHLLEGSLTPAQAARIHPTLLASRMERFPLLDLEDITAYDLSTYEFWLTAEAAARLGKLSVPVSGLPFMIALNGSPRFSGAFWTALSSQSFDDAVVIEVLGGSLDGRLRLDLGYPASPPVFRGVDWRKDPDLLEVFRQAGKLLTNIES